MKRPFQKSRYAAPSDEERLAHVNNNPPSTDRGHAKNYAKGQVCKKEEQLKAKRKATSKKLKRERKLACEYESEALELRNKEKSTAKKKPLTFVFALKIMLMIAALGVVLAMASKRILAILASDGSTYTLMVMDRPMEANQLVILMVGSFFLLAHFITRLPRTQFMQRRFAAGAGILAIPFALFSVVEFSVTSFKPGEFNYLFTSVKPLVHFFENDSRVFIISMIIVAEVLITIVIDFCILTALSSRRIHTDSDEVRRLLSKAGKHCRRVAKQLKKLGKLKGLLSELGAEKRWLSRSIENLLAEDRRKLGEEEKRKTKIAELKKQRLGLMDREIHDLENTDNGHGDDSQPRFPFFDKSA